VGLLDLIGRGTRSLDDACALAEDLADGGSYISLHSTVSLSADLLHAVVTRLASASLSGVSEVSLPIDSVTDARWAGDDQLSWTFTDVADPVELLAPRLEPFGARAALELPASRRRTESECRSGAARIRLVRGTTSREGREYFGSTHEADKAFVRCAKALLNPEAGNALLPSFATGDVRLIEIVQALAQRFGRARDEYEFVVPYGRDREAHALLARAGQRVRTSIEFQVNQS